MKVENPISDMIWDGAPERPGFAPTVRNSRFPERAGRTAPESINFSIPTIEEIADVRVDRVLYRSVSTMEAGE